MKKVSAKKAVERDDGIEELSKVVNKIKTGENKDEEVEAPSTTKKQS